MTIFRPDGEAGHAPEAERFVALVVASDDGAAAEAITAVGLARGRVLARVGWDEAAPAIAALGRRAIVLVEALATTQSDTGDDVLGVALPLIDRAIAASGLPVIVTLGDWQIDVVGASLLGEGAQLLCAPTMTDRVTALGLASGVLGATILNGTVAEEEHGRLARLHAEIARIADMLARLSQSDQVPQIARRSLADRRIGYDAGPEATDAILDPQDIRRTIRARRLRDKEFGSNMFEDPAWDMMLDLFAAHLERIHVSVSSLCIAAAVAPTTALRWIGKMTDAGLFVREPDPLDRRRAFMTLSRSAVEKMRAHMTALSRAELPLA